MDNDKRLNIFKVGGNVIENDETLTLFVKKFAKIPSPKLLVHGGGKRATQLCQRLGITPQMIEGRRITDAETLEVVTMVYAGSTNKQIVAKLQAEGCNAIGLTGADGNLIKAHKRVNTAINYGFVGDFEPSDVNTMLIKNLIQQSPALTPVVCAITHNKQGQLLNTNADTIAANLAIACSKMFEVHLTYCFERAGVLLDIHDESSLIKKLTPAHYQKLRKEEKVSEGMIPKLDNCFFALESGVQKITIQDALAVGEEEGTVIVH